MALVLATIVVKTEKNTQRHNNTISSKSKRGYVMLYTQNAARNRKTANFTQRQINFDSLDGLLASISCSDKRVATHSLGAKFALPETKLSPQNNRPMSDLL